MRCFLPHTASLKSIELAGVLAQYHVGQFDGPGAGNNTIAQHAGKRDGQRLPATYVNFYFVNGALLVPTFRNRKNDRKAIDALQSHLPGHKVIGIDCVELIWGLGAIHCLTQQQPKF